MHSESGQHRIIHLAATALSGPSRDTIQEQEREIVMAVNYLQSAVSGLVMDIHTGDAILSGSTLQVFDKKTEANQWWTTEDVPGQPGYFWIVSAVQNLVIDISSGNGGIQSGSALQVLEKKSETNQYWTTKDVPGKAGYFWIVSADQGLVIDISTATTIVSGSALQALVQKSEDNQYWTWVAAPVASAPSALGSNSNYFLYGGTTAAGKYIPLKDIVVTIEVTEDLVGTPPFNFQLNAYSPKNEVDGWQQYGISMAPNSAVLNSFAENWPLSGANLFNIEPDGFIAITNDKTIPKGYKIVIELTYATDGTDSINGSVVTVYSGSNKLGSQTIALIGQNLAAGGKVTSTDLAPIVAYQLNLVAWADREVTALTSGAGTITYSSSTSMTAVNGRPGDAEDAVITAETANSIYSVMASGSSTSFTQPFGVTTDGTTIRMPGGHAKVSRFQPPGRS